jgi:alpha-L-rhamnosidase
MKKLITLLISCLLSISLQHLFAQDCLHSFGMAQWIGAITRKASHIPEGRIYQGTALKQVKVKSAWAAVDSLSRRSIYLRRAFNLSESVKKAELLICGLGHYELTINGGKVGGNQEFAPLWSDYDKTVYYNCFDVTSFLHKGENVAGVLLGNGFYNAQGESRYRKLQISFGPLTLLFKLVITYDDGTMQTVCSDGDWKYSFSPITFNSIYGGEDYDARLEQIGWDKPRFKARNWYPIVLQEAPKGILRCQIAPPVTIYSYYDVKSVHKLSTTDADSASKSTKRTVDHSAIVFDMGQNLAGFPEIKIKGERGQRIVLLMAEGITKEGAVDQRQTGRPYYDIYTLKGDGEEVWHPRFTYYGFRYIQVEGAVLSGDKNKFKLPVLKQIRSCFVSNSVKNVSTFECSNSIFNAAHRLIQMAVRSNMQGIFTDCPHREKLGWLEQLHLNGPGLFFNYDLSTLMLKIMQDMLDAQGDDGAMPNIAPHYVDFREPGMNDFEESPEWGSSLIVIPFQYLYYYGDSSLIKTNYRSMAKYVDYLGTRSKYHILSFGLGDWYDYGNFRAGFSHNTPVPLVATAHYYMDVCYMQKAAKIVGNKYDESFYQKFSEKIRTAFNKAFYHSDTSEYGTGSQCSNALPLFLNMENSVNRTAILNNLIKDIKSHGDRFTTGDVGNRYLFQTLARNGLNELMYKMHNHEDAPGYGFQLKFGATTLTEQWDPRESSSWNHFMMGQIDEWFFVSLAGIGHEDDGQGFCHIVIHPQVVGDLTYVKSSYISNKGLIKVEWHRSDHQVTLNVTIPKDCTAKVFVPGDSNAKSVKGGTYLFIGKL